MTWRAHIVLWVGLSIAGCGPAEPDPGTDDGGVDASIPRDATIAMDGGALEVDAPQVDAPTPLGARYPHRPASFTHSTEIDFSQPIPPSPGSDRPIGIDGWSMIFDGSGTSNWSAVTASDAPESPPGIWRGHWAAGAYGGGVIGAGDGHGIGNVYTNLPSRPSALYASVRMRLVSGYEWHPVSNKFIAIWPDQILVQLEEGGNWLHGEVLGIPEPVWLDPSEGAAPDTVMLEAWNNTPITVGDWHQIELLIDRPAGTFEIWLDGEVTTRASHLGFTSDTHGEFTLTAFRGGGGETLSHDMEWEYDHVLLAW